jgi:hypothetical protein
MYYGITEGYYGVSRGYYGITVTLYLTPIALIMKAESKIIDRQYSGYRNHRNP